MMWNNLSIYWQEAIQQAIEAMNAGSLAIGAVIVDPEGKIVSRGRNRLFEPERDSSQISGSSIAHAEIDAIASLPKNCGKDFAIYTTTEPCPMCVGAICMSKIRQIYFASRDTWAGSTCLLDSSEYLRHQKIKVVGPEDEKLENVLIALHVFTHMRRDSSERLSFLFDRWSEFAPKGVALGKRISEEKALEDYVIGAEEPSVVIDFLETRLLHIAWCGMIAKAGTNIS